MAGSWRKPTAVVAALVLVLALAVPSTGLAAAKAKHAPAAGLRPAVASFAEDAFEPDDTTATATVFNPAVHGNTWTSSRTIHGYGDQIEDGGDWVAITVDTTGTPIWAETEYVSGYYDTYLRLYDSDGAEVAESDDSEVWPATYSSNIYYECPAPGTYYLAAEPYDYSYYPYAYKLHITVGDARRVWGANRYATAANLSKLMWDNTNNPWYGPDDSFGCIVVASGTNPADALAGGALAATMDGVLLLTNPTSLSPETKAEILRVTESLFWDYGHVKVYVLGGPGAVSDAVVKQIEGLRTVNEVERLEGADRFETAAAIASEIDDEVGTYGYVYLVNGYQWADALAAAPVAAWAGAPVLMTKAGEVPAATLDWMDDHGVTDIYIVGGTGVVGAGVKTFLENEGYTVERIAGDNRYETAAAVAQHGVDEWGMDPYLVNLASGESFADALAAAPLSWWTGGPLLLTKSASLSQEVRTYFANAGWIGESNWTGCYVIGGPGAISPAAYNEFRDLWKTTNDWMGP